MTARIASLPQVARLSAVRDLTERLAGLLSPEDQQVQEMADASPAMWHRADTTWSWEDRPDPTGTYDSYDSAYRFSFESDYEAVGPRQPRAQRRLITRPTAELVGRYRAAVDEAVTALLTAGVDDGQASLVQLGINNEQANLRIADAPLSIEEIFGVVRDTLAVQGAASASGREVFRCA